MPRSILPEATIFSTMAAPFYSHSLQQVAMLGRETSYSQYLYVRKYRNLFPRQSHVRYRHMNRTTCSYVHSARDPYRQFRSATLMLLITLCAKASHPFNDHAFTALTEIYLP